MRLFQKLLMLVAIAPCVSLVGCSEGGPAVKTEDSAKQVQEDMTKMQQMLPQNPEATKPQPQGGAAPAEGGK
ncbi:MAG: hypothetical protein ACM3U2_01350 [Deltaproteobacteria bacterium]